VKQENDKEKAFGIWDGQCNSCDIFGRVNDLGLCEDCAGKLERDLIRQNDWDYTYSGFPLNDEQRQKLRSEIIKKYGPSLELISPDTPKRPRKQKTGGK
jgi:hypothetical protein